MTINRHKIAQQLRAHISPELIKVLLIPDIRSAFVGGCVRDLILEELGRPASPIDDIDIIVEGVTYEELTDLIRSTGLQCIVAGKDFAVIKAMDPLSPGGVIDIALGRSEQSIGAGHRDFKVTTGTSIEEDSNRRDFTAGAISITLQDELIDPQGGVSDLQQGLLRAVGNPDERFREDPLRLLRAPRLAAKLGLEIEQQTANSIRQNASLLSHISAERILQELEKSSKNAGWSRMTRMLDELGLIEQIIPEWSEIRNLDQCNPHHHDTASEHTLKVCEHAEQLGGKGLTLMLSCLMHDIGKGRTRVISDTGRGSFHGHEEVGSQIATSRLKALKCSSKVTEDVAEMVNLHMRLNQDCTTKSLRRLANRVGQERIETYLQLCQADRNAHVGGISVIWKDRADQLMQCMNSIAEAGGEQCFDERQLALRGPEIMALGVPQRRIGEVKRALTQEIIDGEIPNDIEILRRRANEIASQIATT